MKNLALVAIILGSLSNIALAQSDVSEFPSMTLAYNSTNTSQWLITPSVSAAEIPAPENAIEETLDAISEQLSTKLDQQLEEKITKELDYAMQ